MPRRLRYSRADDNSRWGKPFKTHKSVQPQKGVEMNSLLRWYQSNSTVFLLARRGARNGAHFAGREERHWTKARTEAHSVSPSSPHLTKWTEQMLRQEESALDGIANSLWTSVGGWIIFCTIFQRFRPLFGHLLGLIYCGVQDANYGEFGGTPDSCLFESPKTK